jgi:hypothetical protein
MTAFQLPIDIGNRALQHVGAEMMDTSLGFADGKVGRQTGFVYDKARRAELRRNVWRFAIREACLRPIDSNTMILAPSLWSSFATYFVGSVVSDSAGNLWSSRLPNNLGYEPGTVPAAWEPYFGPLSVSLYDSTYGYFAGEVVYTAAGDGTANIYMSLVNSNFVHPALPNLWNAGTVYQLNQVVIAYPAWDVTLTYPIGSTVTYTDGNVYASLGAGNTGLAPPSFPSFWALVPTLTLHTQPVPISPNIQFPPTSSPVQEWRYESTYTVGNVVIFNSAQYVAIISTGNTGKFPNAPASTFWARLTGGTPYMSLIPLNLGNPPASSPTQWTTAFPQGVGNNQWTQIGGAAFPFGVTLTTPNLVYPLNAGPVSQTGTRNVYRLPSGFLREAPQDPTAGSTSQLGASTALSYLDWRYEGNYIVTREVGAMVYRFVADITDVSAMDDMFCELIALRIGLEVCEPLTQSSAKLGTIAQMYKQFGGEARTVNGIETGPVEPAEDDFVRCRL